MSQDLLASLEYIEKEKGITKEVLLDALRHALISACRKNSPETNQIHNNHCCPTFCGASPATQQQATSRLVH
jgi:hypothetical protein